MFKSDVTENTKNNTFHESSVTNREKRLENMNKFLIFLIFLLIVFLGVGTIVVVIFPKPVVVVDRKTGEIIGEYQTSAYRTDDEIIGGSKRFLNYHLSFNAETVYDDFANAINMMSNDLKRKRVKYLQESNLPNSIFKAKSKSTLNFDKCEIISKKQGVSFVELKGDLIFLAGSPQDKRVPFHFILTIKPVLVSSLNTSGIKLIDYEEKEVASENKDNNTK